MDILFCQIVEVSSTRRFIVQYCFTYGLQYSLRRRSCSILLSLWPALNILHIFHPVKSWLLLTFKVFFHLIYTNVKMVMLLPTVAGCQSPSHTTAHSSFTVCMPPGQDKINSFCVSFTYEQNNNSCVETQAISQQNGGLPIHQCHTSVMPWDNYCG